MLTPLPSAASIAMCERPSEPAAGAPRNASVAVSAQAATSGARRGSSASIRSASSLYPVIESSGKTTTRAPAERITAAWVSALAATS
jgi:hypothetical protein